MTEMTGLYALWYRELKVFTREKSRIIGSVVNPLIWLVAFGGGLGSFLDIGSTGYIGFIFPGVLMLTVLFTAIFFGLYIVMDKKIDFFKSVLVAPIARVTLFTGKMLGGCTDAFLQAAILLFFGIFFGIPYTPYSLSIMVVFILLLSMAITSLGLAIGSMLNSFEGFGLIQSFVIMPLFFLSGALYPLDNIPSWMVVVTRANPLTYIVDGMRGGLYGINAFPMSLDLGVAILFAAVLIAVGTYAFNRMT
jgi:ABC-2 type transport system permease protein